MINNKLLIIIAITIGFLVGTKTAFSQMISDEVKQNIKERVDNGDNMSIAIGVINEKGETSFYNYGVTDKESAKQVDENTLYEIGSISKVYTALLLAQMEQNGVMSIDDPVQKYMPDDVKLPIKDGEVVRLKHLSTHSSGLPGMPTNIDVYSQTPYATYDATLMYAFLKETTLAATPGEKYDYSNLAVSLLGQVMIEKSGKTYEELLQSMIFNPMKLTSSTVSLNSQMGERMATGHQGLSPVPNWDMDVVAPAGGIRSSVVDVLQFLKFNMGLEKSDFEAAIKQMQEVHFDNGVKVGLGWHIEGEDYIWHNGGTGGFSSFAGFDRKSKRGVVVLTNTSESVDDIGFHILTQQSPLKKVRKSISIEEAVLENYVGKYQLAPTMIFDITKDGNQLKAQLTGQGKFDVFPISENRFFYKVVEAELEFVKNEKGAIEKVILYQNGMEMPAPKFE